MTLSESEIMLEKQQEEFEAGFHLYSTIKVASGEDLRKQIGKDIYFDLVDHDKVRSFRIPKVLPFNLFKEMVAQAFGIPVKFQCFWIWSKRLNQTYRPYRRLTHREEAQKVGELSDLFNKMNTSELNLFLEVECGQDCQLLPPPEKGENDLLVFCKLYDPEKEQLRYVGRLFVKSFGKPIDIIAKLNDLAGFAVDEKIELFEEIKIEPNVMCERLDMQATFRHNQIQDGDIICFQKQPTPNIKEQARFPDVISFFEYIKIRKIVHFRALESPKEDAFILELAKNHTYDDVVGRVAQRLNFDDPSKIRLIPHNCYSQQPKPNAIKYRSVDQLMDMLVHYNQISDILYYEVLDIPLPELQCLKTLKVAFYHATKDEVVVHNVRLLKQSTVGDVLNEIKSKVELSHPNAELRLLEVFHHKIYKIFPLNEKIENVNDQYWTLRAEEIPEEEKNIGPHDRLIHVYHFTTDTAQNQMHIGNFGDPFLLVIHEGESLAEVKVRVQKKLQVPDKEFSQWKFAYCSTGRPEYLDDSHVLSTRFQNRDVYGVCKQYLGLEHSDTGPNWTFSANKVSQVSQPLVEVVKAGKQGVVEPQESCFTWTIRRFKSLNVKKYYSDVFVSGKCKWKILIYPKGDDVDFLSVFIVVADSDNLPKEWSKFTKIRLKVVNQIDSKKTIKKGGHAIFTKHDSQLGFKNLIPRSELSDPSKGFVVNDTIIIEADVDVCDVIQPKKR